MGRVEKGLQPFQGRPLIERVLERFRPQVDELLISANQSIAAYEAYGVTVVSDSLKEADGTVAGPLAGLHAGLRACRHPLLATVPCDAPHLPDHLVARLREGLVAAAADVAIPKVAAHVQPVFVLARKDVFAELDLYMKSGGRRADGWYGRLRVIEVPFEDAAAFANVNTLAELREMEAGDRPESE